MALTNFGKLTDEQLTTWSRDVWKHARERRFLNQYIGEGADSMVQRIDELTKTKKGARAVMTLVADAEGDGTAGDRTLEGNEEALRSYDQVITIDQLRHAHRHEGRMAEQRSVVKFRKEARDILAHWLADRSDQMAFLTLSGISYAYKTNGAARVGSDLPYLDYASQVTAPSANRHLRWDAADGLVAGDTTAVATGDTPSWAMLVELKAYAEDHHLKPIRMDGEEFYAVFMTPKGMAKLKQDSDFLANLRNAMPRSTDNVLFKGANKYYVDGLLITSYKHVYNTTGVAAPNKWGGSGDVDGQRVLFCGAQALGYADIGMPEWVEKGFDYDNQQGISVGKIQGVLKPVFHAPDTSTDEDFGVIVCDTSLK